MASMLRPIFCYKCSGLLFMEAMCFWMHGSCKEWPIIVDVWQPFCLALHDGRSGFKLSDMYTVFLKYIFTCPNWHVNLECNWKLHLYINYIHVDFLLANTLIKKLNCNEHMCQNTTFCNTKSFSKVYMICFQCIHIIQLREQIWW